MMPFDYPTDRAALEAALPTIGLVEPQDAKILWIKNTLDLAEVECGAAYFQEATRRDDLEVLSALREFPFDAEGNLLVSLAAGGPARS
jgi:hypothetical protein